MKRLVLWLLIATSPAHAEPKKKNAPAPIESPSVTHPTSGKPSIEFQGDPTDLVLRTLAKQAKINLVVSSDVKGTVTMRIEDHTPREVIEIICQSKNLTFSERNGTFFVDDPAAAKAEDERMESGKPTSESFEESLTKTLTPGLIAAGTKLYDTVLDIAARPETARKVARAKKALFDALIAEGFTREEALKLVIYSGKVELPNLLE